jgi:hypothetical protein
MARPGLNHSPVAVATITGCLRAFTSAAASAPAAPRHLAVQGNEAWWSSLVAGQVKADGFS